MSASLPDRPSLTVVRGWSVGTSFPIDRPVMVVGRDEGCHIALGSMAVSRRHARLFAQGGGYVVEDLGSTQGTLLNGEPLAEPTLVQHGDLIQLGDCLLSYSSAGTGAEQDEGETTILRSRDSSGTGEWTLAGVRPEEKLRAILEIGRELMGPLDLDQVLSRILESLFRLFPQAERGFVILAEGREFVPKAIKLRDPEGTQRSPSRTVLDHVIGAGKAILSEDLQGDDRFGGSRSVDEARLRTLMCVPLRDHSRKPIGALQIDTSSPLARFVAEDLDLLVAVAGQVSLAVDNARLHHAAQESLRRHAEAQAFVDAMLAAAPIAMAFLDPQLRYVRVNRRDGRAERAAGRGPPGSADRRRRRGRGRLGRSPRQAGRQDRCARHGG